MHGFLKSLDFSDLHFNGKNLTKEGKKTNERQFWDCERQSRGPNVLPGFVIFAIVKCFIGFRFITILGKKY